jgi:hypothetical protein
VTYSSSAREVISLFMLRGPRSLASEPEWDKLLLGNSGRLGIASPNHHPANLIPATALLLSYRRGQAIMAKRRSLEREVMAYLGMDRSLDLPR